MLFHLPEAIRIEALKYLLASIGEVVDPLLNPFQATKQREIVSTIRPLISSRLDDYLRFDLSATYTFNLSDKISAFVGASVWNLTNQTNVVNVFHRINDNDEVERVEQTSLGITPNVSLRVSF